MKKLVFGVGFILALALPIKNTLSQPAEIKPVVNLPVIPADANIIKRAPARLQDNSALPVTKLISQDKIVSRLTKKATLKSIRLVKYSDYQSNRIKIVGVAAENAEISPSRQVYEVILDFPQGFKIRVGSYDRATVTALFDAETGESLSTDIDAPASAFHSNYDPVIAPTK
ncbi:hypothetical protein [Nostoc sp.]|uniref:hypothetical protein n=1 Tax=Nostoc sp. TaxID=1180 RepID=UPI002FFCD37F